MHCKRSVDAVRFNEIANHPDVRPWLGGADGPLDFTRVTNNTANICFLSDGGGYICHNLDGGRYEVHSLFLPDARGAHAVAVMQEASRFMFCNTDCTELVTKCPDENRAALGIARIAGFREIFRREKCWNHDGQLVGISHQALDFEAWKKRDPVIKARGEWFHVKLEEAKKAIGSTLPVHDEDEAHDRAVGASVLMAMNANPRKAVWSYNRWAKFANYAPIMLLSETPVLIDVVDAVVSPCGEDMEILLCRVEQSPP